MLKKTFSKNEKLCNYTHIQQIFSEGKSVKSFPLKLIYVPIQTHCLTPVKVLVSVPKRSVKRAVVRNYIKRIIRESYRLQKHLFWVEEKQYAIAFVYMSKEKISFHELYKTMEILAEEWQKEITFLPTENQDLC